MGPSVDVVPSSEQFPRQAEVAVIGGGIVGIATAWALVQRGIPTVLLEKGTVAAEQSSRNWGWCRRTGRDLRELPLINASMALWEQMNQQTGQETGYRRQGIIFASHTDRQRDSHQRWLEEARQFGIHSQQLAPGQLAQKVPGLRDVAAFTGALYTDSDGRAEPQHAAPAMAKAAMALGLNLQQHCAVRGLERSAGRISGVMTEYGTIACRSVVVAGGAWSRLLMSAEGISLPQLKVLSTVLRTRPVDYAIGPCAALGSVALRKRLDGGLTVASAAISTVDITPDALRFGRQFLPAYRVERAGLRLRLGQRFTEEWLRWRPRPVDKVSVYEQIRVLDPAIDPAVVDRMMRDLADRIPALNDLPVAQSWGGLIDTLPDAIPVISDTGEGDGLYLATGFSGHGFGIAPAAGQLMADLVTGQTPIVDPHPFRLARFRDGEKIRAQHWL